MHAVLQSKTAAFDIVMKLRLIIGSILGTLAADSESEPDVPAVTFWPLEGSRNK